MHHDPGSEALGFMRAELSQGGPLAKRLVAIPPKGRVFSILPPDTSRADLIDFGSGPFHSNQSDHESIIKAARETHWYPSVEVISSLKRGEPLLEPGSAQSVSILDDLVTRIDAVLVGAYDTDSWLVWYPDHGLDAIS
jgi:hypothetical protein